MATLSEIKRRPIYDPWKLTEIKYEGTEDGFTSSAGLGPLLDLFSGSSIFHQFKKCLPARISNASYDTSHFGLTLFAGFLYGHDCLDDLEEFQADPLISIKLDGVPSAKAMGDWLRDFKQENIQSMDGLLSRQAVETREKLTKSQDITIDIDSTSHIQRGIKAEGLSYNYKGEWCLDSLVAFDELGLCHAMDLRPGSTFSCENGDKMIDRIFSQFPFKKKKYLRGDSAFCNEDMMRVALRHGAKFTFAAHERILWTQKISTITNWEAWVYTDEEKKKAQKQGVELPKIELGSYRYQPEWTDNLWFSVIIKRTWSFIKEEGSWGWTYYAIVTNWDLFYHRKQKVMEHYQMRGHAENFIREEKYGWDLKHFPCKKMMANHAYGLLALVTHNFLRTVALLENPKNPHFSKKIRRKFIFIPGKLTRHSRQWVMKIPNHFWKEVQRLIHAWTAAFSPVLARAG
jgi:hypothetical protein